MRLIEPHLALCGWKTSVFSGTPEIEAALCDAPAPDALVLGAGEPAVDMRAWDEDLSEWLAQPISALRAAIGAMVRARRGAIVVALSTRAFAGDRARPGIAAAEGALIGAIRSLGIELLPNGVSVNGVVMPPRALGLGAARVISFVLRSRGLYTAQVIDLSQRI